MTIQGKRIRFLLKYTAHLCRLFQKAYGKYIFNNLLILRSIFIRLMRLPLPLCKILSKILHKFFQEKDKHIRQINQSAE